MRIAGVAQPLLFPTPAEGPCRHRLHRRAINQSRAETAIKWEVQISLRAACASLLLVHMMPSKVIFYCEIERSTEEPWARDNSYRAVGNWMSSGTYGLFSRILR